jgi:excisionase family DNA binding protein
MAARTTPLGWPPGGADDLFRFPLPRSERDFGDTREELAEGEHGDRPARGHPFPRRGAGVDRVVARPRSPHRRSASTEIVGGGGCRPPVQSPDPRHLFASDTRCRRGFFLARGIFLAERWAVSGPSEAGLLTPPVKGGRAAAAQPRRGRDRARLLAPIGEAQGRRGVARDLPRRPAGQGARGRARALHRGSHVAERRRARVARTAIEGHWSDSLRLRPFGGARRCYTRGMPATKPPPEYLRVDEVAEVMRVHPVTVRRWLASGELHGTKVGGVVRVPRDELDRVLRPPDLDDAA